MGVAQITAGPITVVAGKTYRIAIDAPPRGEIVQAQCVQLGGTPNIFSFAFYNSAKSCPPGGPVTTVGDATVDPMVEYAGQIGPTRALTAAKDRFVAADGSDAGWTSAGSYSNADAGHSDAKSKLYMKFVAGGAGTYYIFLTIKTTRD
jgi:hypothetical protein